MGVPSCSRRPGLRLQNLRENNLALGGTPPGASHHEVASRRPSSTLSDEERLVCSPQTRFHGAAGAGGRKPASSLQRELSARRSNPSTSMYLTCRQIGSVRLISSCSSGFF